MSYYNIPEMKPRRRGIYRASLAGKEVAHLPQSACPGVIGRAGEIRNSKSNGFTLIELIMVIVLLAILAAVAAPRLGDITGTNTAAFVSKLQADLRYAQNLAMTQQRRYRVYFNASPSPAQGYAAVNDADGDGAWGESGEFASDPAGGGNLSVTLNAGAYSGITISAVGFADSYVEFDSLGVPYDADGVLAAAKSVTITGGSTSRTVTVQAQTGAVN